MSAISGGFTVFSMSHELELFWASGSVGVRVLALMV